MAVENVPSDSAVRDALANLKLYTAYKANQLQTQGEGGSGLEGPLATVDTWGRDMADDGKEWGKTKEAEADKKIERSDKAQQQVAKDEQQAQEDAKARSEMDMDAFKKDSKKKIDDYREAMKQLAEAGKPGFKEKLTEVNVETAEAKSFLDSGLDEAVEMTAKKNTENRARRKAFAEEAQKDADEGQAWKDEYSDQPEKFPQGQREDVKQALSAIQQGSVAKAQELQPLGERAKPYMQKAQSIGDWAEALAPRVDANGDALLEAKKDAREGVAHARKQLLEIEKFQASVEGSANKDMETFRRWTDHNNKLAAQWINSDSDKHKAWAKRWMQTQKK